MKDNDYYSLFMITVLLIMLYGFHKLEEAAKACEASGRSREQCDVLLR